MLLRFDDLPGKKFQCRELILREGVIRCIKPECDWQEDIIIVAGWEKNEEPEEPSDDERKLAEALALVERLRQRVAEEQRRATEARNDVARLQDELAKCRPS